MPAVKPPSAYRGAPVKPRPAHRAPSARSRVTNGHQDFLATIDQRSRPARRWRDIFDQITADLGGDLSMAQTQLVRRAATIAVQCELIEVAMATGDPIDINTLNTYGQMSDRLGRCLQRLGIKREPRNVTPDLASYIKHRQAEAKALPPASPAPPAEALP